MASEAQAAVKHVYAKLSAAAAVTALVSTRIYEPPAPSEASYPLLLVTQLSANALFTAGSDNRLMTRQIVVVQAVDLNASHATADSVLSAADEALTDSTGTVTVGAITYTVMSVRAVGQRRSARLEQGRRACYSITEYLMEVREGA